MWLPGVEPSWPGCTTDQKLLIFSFAEGKFVTAGLYVGIMELGSYSEDRLDRLIADGELEIARIRLVQMTAIGEKRRRRSHSEDGYRSTVDWTAVRPDVSHETARSICWTATRLEDAPEVAEQLASGEISFDRAEQIARLPEQHRSGHEGMTFLSSVVWLPITNG